MKLMIIKTKTLVVAVVIMMTMTMTMMVIAKGYDAIMKSQGSLWFSPVKLALHPQKSSNLLEVIFLRYFGILPMQTPSPIFMSFPTRAIAGSP
jgi:hypothetical protein